MAEVSLRNITKYHGECRVIDDLSLDVRSGEFVTLLGPSGCGKTTLLRMVAGLAEIDKGELRVGGKLFNHIPAQCRGIAMVFQSYALFPHMRVKENITFGLAIRRAAQIEKIEKLNWVIPLLGLEGLENRFPREISGGQRQRVALARALVINPQVLLIDEPLSNLDSALRDAAMEELKRIHRKVGKTILFVTHNQAEAMSMSERIAVIRCGKLEQYDTPRMVYDFPRTMFSAEFIGTPSINMIDGEISVENDCAGIRTAAGFFMLDKEREIRAKSMAGRHVKAGIRPQGISFKPGNEARRYSDTSLCLSVEMAESTGDRNLIVTRAGGNTVLRFLVSSEEDLDAGAQITAMVDGRRIHVFDPETQLNIFL
jgi:multiple sugar transport system ATP-binding protein